MAGKVTVEHPSGLNASWENGVLKVALLLHPHNNEKESAQVFLCESGRERVPMTSNFRGEEAREMS